MSDLFDVFEDAPPNRPENGLVRTCKHCGDDGPHPVHLMESGMHYAKALCFSCTRFVDWVSKPDKKTSKRSASHTDLVKAFGRGYCELCGIRREDMPRAWWFEAHHVDEYQAGGEPTRENIWILCSQCHGMVTTRRAHVKALLALSGKFTAWSREE